MDLGRRSDLAGAVPVCKIASLRTKRDIHKAGTIFRQQFLCAFLRRKYPEKIHFLVADLDDVRLMQTPFDLLFGGSFSLGIQYRGSGGQCVVQCVQMRICKEVVQCNQLCLRGALSGTVSQNALTDHYVRIGRDGVYAGVGHGQIGAFGFDAVVELGSTHGAGTHTGIASKDNLADLTDIYGSRFRNLALSLCLHLLHFVLGIGQALGMAGGCFQDDRGQDKGDCTSDDNAQQDGEDGIPGSHCHVGNEGTGRSRAGQVCTCHGVEQDGAEVAYDGGDNDHGIHQDVGKVDLVDAAQQVDDDSTGSGLAGGVVLTEEAVGQQDAKAGAGVGIQHIHDGATGLSSLTCTDGAEDAVVDGVVQEQHLGRLNKDGHQRQQAVRHKEVHTGGQHGEDGGHERADDVVAKDGQQHTQNADGEVVDQHLETGIAPDFNGDKQYCCHRGMVTAVG